MTAIALALVASTGIACLTALAIARLAFAAASLNKEAADAMAATAEMMRDLARRLLARSARAMPGEPPLDPLPGIFSGAQRSDNIRPFTKRPEGDDAA